MAALYDLGYSAEQVHLAFGFVDWLLRLPDALRGQFVQELRMFEEDRQMTYITSIEELGIEKGIEKGRAVGLLDGIALALDLKYGDAAAPVIGEVRQLTDLALLEAILAQIKTAATLDDVRRVAQGLDHCARSGTSSGEPRSRPHTQRRGAWTAGARPGIGDL